MPAKIDPNTLTLKDIQVFDAHVVKGKTIAETAKIVGVSTDTVKRIKKKPAFRDLGIEALEKFEHTVERHIKRLIEKSYATKSVNICGERVIEDDNPTQMKALDTITDIYGLRAPKHIELSGALAGASDAELFEEIEEAAGGQSSMVPESGEQGDGTEDSGDVEGTIL